MAPVSSSHEPYCGNCGYRLSGAVDSSKCPECGRPLVEVLTRGGQWGRRYRSAATLLGLPIIDVALGPRPGERTGKACGIIAIGNVATGLLALGGVARGLVAFGGVALGGLTFGGVSIGLISSLGGLALGGLASGGGAVGYFASGGGAVGYAASGGLAVGYYASGGSPFGVHTLGPGTSSAQAIAMFDANAWFFGGSAITPMTILQPLLTCSILPVAAALAVGILALAVHLLGWGGPPSASGVES